MPATRRVYRSSSRLSTVVAASCAIQHSATAPTTASGMGVLCECCTLSTGGVASTAPMPCVARCTETTRPIERRHRAAPAPAPRPGRVCTTGSPCTVCSRRVSRSTRREAEAASSSHISRATRLQTSALSKPPEAVSASSSSARLAAWRSGSQAKQSTSSKSGLPPCPVSRCGGGGTALRLGITTTLEPPTIAISVPPSPPPPASPRAPSPPRAPPPPKQPQQASGSLPSGGSSALTLATAAIASPPAASPAASPPASSRFRSNSRQRSSCNPHCCRSIVSSCRTHRSSCDARDAARAATAAAWSDLVSASTASRTISSASHSLARLSSDSCQPSSAALRAAATASRWWKETLCLSCSRV